ncbi:hypothetical protein GE061_011776 [Apolygus lucorum]|uniref:Uncharacterized protein n=1 Tax=Apolygus lucorum TaxID=248454 RepID=A0A6A4IZ42_APOLU|nr:hypothetical protein GE061_011776 [Apolygus lucorum]
MVTLSYTDTLQGTMERQTSLKESKYFDCKCERCKDPTELGTNFSSLRCPKCDKGFLLPKNSLDASSPWSCRNSRCESIEISTDVLSITQKIRNEMEGIGEGNIKIWEDFLRKHENVLHPNHHILTKVKISLSQMYGKVPNYIIDEMSLEQLQRKINLCQDVLKLTDVFEPGLSRIRGVTLYELHAPLLLYAIKTFHSGSSNKELLKRRLREVVGCLEDARRILSFEDPSSAEGKILSTIENALKETKTWDTQLKNLR